ncbi:TetR/AcrR family transcriptional regulator [Gulosibacter molinativorax]|uniref:TetR/AcrR family transcriptional regulator n=1 Tax=Gulosibacter molinativorax TaxID=256821 RepID=A0ABT7CCT4_9MICO|nr:TetR family transcriptional regulator [Gulosibacter molinativorax]MDJ1372376.1 TetR/AcrR family transcriptional regulator [Gulosibacter molinativorax]QUY63535.1 Tetracycline repressor protein class E [Gulosibacter molinativorax]
MAKRGAGRPRQAVLNRARITDAAIALLKAGGLRALTMSALAARLGVSPSALYNHTDSRATVLVWVQEAIANQLDASGFGSEPWRAATEKWAWSYYRLLRENPWFVEITATVPLRKAEASARMYERVAYGLRAEGWLVRDVLHTISALESFIFGAAFDAAAPNDIYFTGEHSKAAPILTAIVEAHNEVIADPEWDTGEYTFNLGLQAMLDGLHARHSNPRIANE